MSTTSEKNKRIAKNTMMLYIRMLLTMGVTLYTSRVVLDALGVEDFGIYNVVGGVVVLFSFVNNAMVSSTQRFLNYELGRNDEGEAKRVFSASLTIHIGIALLLLLLAETIGLWFIDTYINIPPERIVAAHWVYQYSVLVACVSIVRSPYNAVIIAYEKMSFYAYISIIEVVLKLFIVYLLVIGHSDKLIKYAFLQFLVVILVSIAYKVYCKRHFTICRYSFFRDKALNKKLMSFSGWSLFGSVANVGVSQGQNILVNIFFGVTVNAAMGIANQVSSAVYGFVANFQMAFNPQIVKSYASDDKSYFLTLASNASRYSYFLLFLFTLPLFVGCPKILSLWLVEVPDYTVVFCRWMLVISLFDALSGSLWMSVQATGKVRNYQIYVSALLLLNLPITYIALNAVEEPSLVLGIRALLCFVIYLFRVAYLHILVELPWRYLYEVFGRCLLVSLVAFPVSYYLDAYTTGVIGLILSCSGSLIFLILTIYTLGMNKKERTLIVTNIKKRIGARIQN